MPNLADGQIQLLQQRQLENVPQQDANIRNQLRQASALEQQGRLEEASKVYRQLYEQHPEQEAVYRNYVDILVRMSDYGAAEAVISRYLKSHPSDIQSLVKLGTVFYNQNDKEKALRQWRSVLESLGRNTRNYQVILNEMVRNGLYTEARETANEARDVLGQPSFYALQLGSVFSSRLNYDHATEEYLLYYRHHGRNVSFLISQISRFPDEPEVNDQVIPVLESAIEEYPKDTNLYKILADYLYRIQEYDRALEHYRTLEQLEQAPGKYRRTVAGDFLEDEEYVRARTLYRTLLNLDEPIQNPASLRYGYAEAGYQNLLEKYDHESGVTVFRRNIFWDPDFVVIPEEAGPELSQVVADFDSVVSIDTNTEYAQLAEYRLGELYFRLGNDFDRAMQYFRQCTGDPNHLRYAESLLYVGKVYLAKGNIEKARNHWNQAIDKIKNPESSIPQSMRLYRAGTFFYAGDVDSGLTQLTDLLNSVNLSSELFNDIMEIRTLADNALKNKSASDTSTFRQFFRGEFYLKQHKITEAQKAWLRILDMEKDAPVASYALVRAAQMGRLLNQREQVQNWLTSVIENYPETPIGDQAMFLLGEVYQEENKLSEAIHWYEQVLVKHPGSILEQIARQRIRQLQQQTS
ncbi:MAG: tetratricopeptide repeat protein [Candidatus Marinimicrobia bacterium]|nr:tetratricopeptide repeat protein [Candidatus Neomarinimicrobiota bacterium]MCF7830136.1 tetratricopeptide repeat protein [Candidatus Neomarinimicrobiota bacterium]MCF7882213.1 tetratricopeptide repeat protein [Candidatus Neomarinimicrobiota bacterium]